MIITDDSGAIITDDLGVIITDDAQVTFAISSYRAEMLDLFLEMRTDEWYRAEVVYGGYTIIGVKMALSVGYQMNLASNMREAKTSVDVLRSEAIAAGLYAPSSQKQTTIKRPEVSVKASVDGDDKIERFFVLDCRDDNDSDPTVKLILSANQSNG